MESFKNYYMILDVEKDAFPSQIKNAYLKSVQKYHPDSVSTQAAHEQFLLASEAYSVLINPIRRRKYDQLYEYYLHHDEAAFRNVKYRKRIEKTIERKAEKSKKEAYKREHRPLENIESGFKAFEWFFRILDFIFNLLELFSS